MSAQLKTHLTVHGGGRKIFEKWLIGKSTFNFKFTVIREPDLQRITFLGFKIFKIFQNYKTTFGYYLSNFCVLLSFQANVLFLYQNRKSARKIFRYFSFLSKNIEKISIYLGDDEHIQLILQPNLVGISVDFCFQDGRNCISILHYAIFLLL